MQKIFYNAKVYTMNDACEEAEAFLINDGSVVFVGSNDEVLKMKQGDTELVDLKQKCVVPALFNNGVSLYRIIENKLKSAKKLKFIEKSDDFDENYERFCNYSIYKSEFLKLQKQLLEMGVTTVKELFLNEKEFTFWKKISSENLLEVDVIGYVDYKQAKRVMDDNCRSFRKYKNHFRLGGYSISLDGGLIEKKAWLTKPYKCEKHYLGYSVYFDEELCFLIKTVLEEKKQLLVEANGDRAVEQFLRCFEETVKTEKVEDVFKPCIISCGAIKMKHFNKMQELKITPSFKVVDLKNEKELVGVLGKNRANKMIPLKNFEENRSDFLLNGNIDELSEPFEYAKLVSNRKLHKMFEKPQNINFSTTINSLIKVSSENCFDDGQKGSIECGKLANFIVLDEVSELKNVGNLKTKVKHVYLNGEKIKI